MLISKPLWKNGILWYSSLFSSFTHLGSRCQEDIWGFQCWISQPHIFFRKYKQGHTDKDGFWCLQLSQIRMLWELKFSENDSKFLISTFVENITEKRRVIWGPLETENIDSEPGESTVVGGLGSLPWHWWEGEGVTCTPLHRWRRAELTLRATGTTAHPELTGMESALERTWPFFPFSVLKEPSIVYCLWKSQELSWKKENYSV